MFLDCRIIKLCQYQNYPKIMSSDLRDINGSDFKLQPRNRMPSSDLTDIYTTRRLKTEQTNIERTRKISQIDSRIPKESKTELERIIEEVLTGKAPETKNSELLYQRQKNRVAKESNFSFQSFGIANEKPIRTEPDELEKKRQKNVNEFYVKLDIDNQKERMTLSEVKVLFQCVISKIGRIFKGDLTKRNNTIFSPGLLDELREFIVKEHFENSQIDHRQPASKQEVFKPNQYNSKEVIFYTTPKKSYNFNKTPPNQKREQSINSSNSQKANRYFSNQNLPKKPLFSGSGVSTKR